MNIPCKELAWHPFVNSQATRCGTRPHCPAAHELIVKVSRRRDREMPAIRKIRKVLKAKPAIEGAGVHLKRVFGFSEVPLFDSSTRLGSRYSEFWMFHGSAFLNGLNRGTDGSLCVHGMSMG
jgi:hypothetical protein